MADIYFIGIDIGTSGAKAVLINVEGEIITTVTNNYPMQNPHPLWAEQNPEDWWKATKKSISEIIQKNKINAENIKGLGLTGQMHGLVSLDKNGNIVYPCIMWNDQRTADECEEITSKIGFENLLKIIGNPVLPGFTAPKLLWLKKNKPEAYNKINKILLPKDYIRFRLTNVFCTDLSDASGTSLLNVEQRKWSDEILEKLNIPKDWLPNLLESVEICGSITKEASDATGLSVGTPVIAGGGDQAAGGIGSGCIKEGVVSIVLGTSGVVFTQTDKFRNEPQGKLHAFCHAVPGKWNLMGVTLSAAGSFKWYKETFFTKFSGSSEDPYDILTESAGLVLPGSEGLIYLPYLSGERTPFSDPDAKGSFVGFTLRHSMAHFTRAVLEGVSYSLKDCFELISSMGIQADKIVISGGGAKSKLWRSIIADLFGVEITTLSCTEGVPFGAAILAATGTGYYKNISEACGSILKTGSTTTPDKDKFKLYNDYYSAYKELYPELKTTFKNILSITKKYYGN